VAKPADEQAIIDMLVEQATAQIAGQRQDADALDAKALGLLAVTAIAVAAMLSAANSLNYWWVPCIFFGLGGVILGSVAWPRKFNAGPELVPLFERIGSGSRSAGSKLLLAQLLKSIQENETAPREKADDMKTGAAVVIAGFLVAIVVVAIDSMT
jgi:hypothetical protein